MNKLEIFKHKINNYYTKHIVFRVFDFSDMFYIYNASLNKEFTEFLLWENNETFINFIKKDVFIDFEKNDNLVISILDNKTGIWIGVIKIIPYKDSYALSFWITKDFWGKGFPLYAVNAFINLYFEYLNYENIYALTKKDYTLMHKICKTYKFELSQGSVILKHENGKDIEFVELCVDKNKFKKLKGDRIYYKINKINDL